LFRVANAALTKFNNYFGDQFCDGITAINQAELAQGALISIGQNRYFIRAQRRIL